MFSKCTFTYTVTPDHVRPWELPYSFWHVVRPNFKKVKNYDKFIHIEIDLYYSETDKYILYTTHCKKDYRFSRIQPGCHQPNVSLQGIQ
jgi:hypothetical protein